MKHRAWYKKLLRWVIFAHYGQEHPFCHHPKVDVRTVQPVTLQPKTGICKICNKEVKAKLIWKEK